MRRNGETDRIFIGVRAPFGENWVAFPLLFAHAGRASPVIGRPHLTGLAITSMAKARLAFLASPRQCFHARQKLRLPRRARACRISCREGISNCCNQTGTAGFLDSGGVQFTTELFAIGAREHCCWCLQAIAEHRQERPLTGWPEHHSTPASVSSVIKAMARSQSSTRA